MAVTEEVMEIVRVLDAEGFGVLAGELLAEISAGREVDVESFAKADLAEDITLPRVAIPADEQLGEAMRILRLRLVEPARHLAEAETIAARLMERQGVAIRFMDDSGTDELAKVDRAPPGDRREADALAEILIRIATSPTATQI